MFLVSVVMSCLLILFVWVGVEEWTVIKWAFVICVGERRLVYALPGTHTLVCRTIVTHSSAVTSILTVSHTRTPT